MNNVMLTKVRLSFPKLTEPSAFNATSSAKYSASFIMDKKSDDFKNFYKACLALANERWGDAGKDRLKKLMQGSKTSCFGDGNNKTNQETGEIYDGYHDKAFVSGKNSDKPQLINKHGQKYANDIEYGELARELYAGCEVNAMVKPYIQNDGDGIRGELVAVQFVADGDTFGQGAVDAQAEFGVVADEAPVQAKVKTGKAPTAPPAPTAPAAAVDDDEPPF